MNEEQCSTEKCAVIHSGHDAITHLMFIQQYENIVF